MKLFPHEIELTGKWIMKGNSVQGDAACERIEELVANHLTQVAFSEQSGGWETLFRDPADGRYWERIYPQSELHGGGPPQLRCLPADVAHQKYGIT